MARLFFSVLAMIKERRILPRLNADIPVEVIMPNGSILKSSTVNLSMNGLKIGCDREQAKLMFSVSANGEPIELKICLKLPITPSPPTEICLLCRIVISRRLKEHIYHIGLKYLNLSDHQRKILTSYLEQQKWPPK